MSWINKLDYPIPPGISFQEMIQLNSGLVLVVSGEYLNSNNDTPVTTCYLYNPNNNTWTVTGSVNTARVTPNLIKLNDGRILCIGGRSHISDGDSLDSCEIYDPNTEIWTVTGSLNVRRYRPAAWKLNSGDVLVAGGLTGNPGFTPVASSEIYSVGGGIWTNPSHDLYQAGAEFYFFLLTDGTPVIAGGQYLSSGFNGSYTYNISTGWQTLDAVNPTGITASDTGRVCVLSNGDILIAGVAGSIGGQLNLSQTTTMIFHQLSQTWETVGNLNNRRQDAIVVALPNGAAFISGGFVDPYAGVLTGEVYNPITKTWSLNSAYNLPTQQTFASYVVTTLTGGATGVFAIGGWDVSGYPSTLVTIANNRFQSITSGGSTSVANNDTSSYTLRWNEILSQLEYSAGLSWVNTGVAVGSGITQLTGDVHAGPGSGSQAATLATVNSNVGSFTSANITVNAKGLITAAANGSGGSSFLINTKRVSTQSTTTVSSTTYTPTGLSMTYTAAAGTNLIKVSGSAVFYINDSGNTLFGAIFKDGVQIGSASQVEYIAAAAAQIVTTSWVFPITANDTSSHTYALNIKSQTGALVQLNTGDVNASTMWMDEYNVAG